MQDEVDPRCWQNNPKIAAWLQQNGMNATQLYAYFETKVSEILHKAGKRMMAWDDVFAKAPGAVQPGDVVVTSAASSLFPANLIIGVVQSVDTQVGPAPEALVQLSAPVESIDWVRVR